MTDAAPEPLPPAVPYRFTGSVRRTFSKSDAGCGLLAVTIMIAIGLELVKVGGSLGWLLALLPIGVLFTTVLLWLASAKRRTSVMRILLHQNGIAQEESGRILLRIFWKDVVNVIEGPGDSIHIYSQEEHLEVGPRLMENGTELRQRILLEWDNLWGYKASTFSDLGYYYPPSARRQLEQRRRTCRMLSAFGVLLIVLWLGVVLHALTGGRRGSPDPVLHGLGYVGWVVLMITGYLLHDLDATLRRIEGVGGIQLGEKELKVISPTGDLREIPFAGLEILDVTPGAPLVLHLKGGEAYTIHREIAYFEKFRLWLIDAAKEQGVKLIGAA